MKIEKFLNVIAFLRRICEKRIRGQVAVFYALVIPIFLFVAGVGLDLGWYYLNVSRLQNAADASALAGARTIIDSNQEKLKDLAPVLVHRLPEDNGLTDDGKPRVETSTSTETSTNTTENEEGTTITTTETTTTTTTTISKTQLKDLNKVSGDETAKDYTAKNLGTTQEVQGAKEKVNLIIDSYSLFDSAVDRKVDTDLNLVKVNGDFYYIVWLGEKIRHFFLPGWFDGMEAGVVAIAKLVPQDQVVVETSTETKTWEEFIAKVREIINRNVIVGNWQVQDKYKNGSGGNLNTKDLNITDSDGNKVTFLDENGNEREKVTAYEASFGTTVYSDAWNHFQDFKNHYYLGDLYRKETVVIKDDVLFEENPNGEDIIDRQGNKGTITSYGAGKYGESSSVAATSASINTDKNNLAYNPGKSNTLKTYQDGITEKDTVGLPYTWKRLDSINIDFRIEDTLSGKWLSEDWDLECGFDGVTTANNQFETSGSEANKIRFDYVKRLRIHTSMNFEDPYPVRPDVDKDSEPDVLWARIESEPILYHPDITARAYGKLTSKISSTGLNSVNQIILNFNKSNYDDTDKYRPLIVFYDGPETNSIYPGYDTVNKFVRKSKPVIVNLNAPYRAILYMPNSPVVVIGDHQNDFKGFIVAKSYLRLKDDEDFILAEDYLQENGQSDLIYDQAWRYFNQPNRQYEYNRKIKADGSIGYQDVGVTGDTYSSQVKKDTDAYRLKVYYAKDDPETDPAKKKRYYKVYGKNSVCPNEFTVTVNNKQYTYFKDNNGMKYIKVIEENGIDMYVDDYGEIQFEDLPNPTKPWKCGVYDNFGRTDFTTHNYKVKKESADNMLLSGSKS